MDLNDKTFELLNVFVDEMEQSGRKHNLIRLTIDEGFLARLNSTQMADLSFAELREIADKCLANEWLEHVVLSGDNYSHLQLTSSGLGVVRSERRQLQELEQRTALKKVSDFAEEHKGVGTLLSLFISLFSLGVAIVALIFSIAKG